MPEFETALEKLAAAETMEEVHSHFVSIVGQQGFSFSTFLRYQGGDRGRPVWLHLPQSFIDEYRANTWRAIDPSVMAARRGSRIINWDEFEVGMLPKGQRQIVDIKRSNGIHSGVTFAMHRGVDQFDCISVARDKPGLIDRDEIPFLYTLAAHAWLQYRKFDGKDGAHRTVRALASKDGRDNEPTLSHDHLRLLFMVELANRYEGFGVQDPMDYVYTFRSTQEFRDVLAWGWVSERANDLKFMYELKLTPLGYTFIDRCPNPREMRSVIAKEILSNSHPAKDNSET